MAGFYLTNNKDGWDITRQTSPKFTKHKFHIDTPSYTFSTDGVIINRDELLQQYNCIDFASLVALLYQQEGETFFHCFRGSFSGVFYDKEKQVMLVFVDQTGSRLFFWQQMEDTIRISSDMLWMAAQQPDMQWDNLGLYELLTYGFMPSHHTIVNGIRRLPAGCYLRIENNRCEQRQYHRFSDHSIKRSQKEEIQGIDKLFRQAVQRVLKVNEEYGYQNIFPLSGGLDSRMANFVAQGLTNRPIENFTYGLPHFSDVKIAKSIAQKLSRKWYFISQEGAKFYANIDTCVRRSGLLISYGGMAEATDSFRIIPTDTIGMILTGICGDEILTSKLNRSSNHYSYGECALSSLRYPEQEELIPKDFSTQYSSRLIFYLYAGSFERHAMGSPLAFQHYTESYSPYMDVDFLEYIFSIPANHRANYRLYDKWILTCHSEAAEWKHNNVTIGKRTPELYIFHRHIPFGTITQRLIWYMLKRLHICNLYNTNLSDYYSKDANPIWQQYYEANRHYLSDVGTVAARIDEQFKSKNVQEKVQAITVLAAIKAIKEAHSSKH